MEEESLYPLVDGEGDHLGNGWKTGDGAVICGVLPVTALEDQDGPSFEEPIVLLVPSIRDFPLHHLFHRLEDSFSDWRAFLDGEGIH